MSYFVLWMHIYHTYQLINTSFSELKLGKNFIGCRCENSVKEIVLWLDRVHIRRTDKLAAEASFHSVAEYMTYVEEYFGRVELRTPGVKRRVFLASDDPTALPEAKKKYVCSCLVKSHRLGAKF